MREEKGIFLFMICTGMELSWIYAWANYLTFMILHRPFPLFEMIGIFILAAALTHLSWGRGWRVIWILGLQCIGFALACLRIIYIFEYGSIPFFTKNWVIEFFNTPRTVLEWLILFFILFWSLFLWINGIRMVRRPKTYFNLCSRFDLGMGAFFLLFLIKLLAFTKGNVRIEEPISYFMIFSFFMFGLLTLGVLRNRSNDRKDFLPGFQGIGMIFSFGLIVILFGSGVTFFFWPYLNWAAEISYRGIKMAAYPLITIFVAVIRFLYFRNANLPAEPSATKEETIDRLSSSGGGTWWSVLIEKYLIWGFIGLIGLAFLIMAGFAIFYVFRWLLLKTPNREKGMNRKNLLTGWIRRLKYFFLYFWRKMIHYTKSRKTAFFFYQGLLSWGRRSGLSRFLSETPQEYGSRLKDRFPQLEREIESIIEAIHLEVYGEKILSREELATSHSALRSLRSPRHWPSRITSLYFRSPWLFLLSTILLR
jgi:hypothetical protein